MRYEVHFTTNGQEIKLLFKWLSQARSAANILVVGGIYAADIYDTKTQEYIEGFK